jgi:iron complex outermembrane receptor protein
VGTSACGPDGRARLSGRYTLDEALSRLLIGAPCQYRIVDAHTVRITRGPVGTAAALPTHEALRSPALVTELVVTATKRPASLDKLPAGVSAISREQIEATNAVDVSRTIGQLAGVLATNLGPGRDKLLIRGLSDGAFTGRTRSTVSTYLDDAPINYNAPDPDLRLVVVERIEVVRGPQGALYGSGAIAGIYRIVTRKPDLGQTDVGLNGALSWTRGGDPTKEIEGYANLPLLEGRAAVRLSAYEDLQGGYLDDVRLRATNVDQTKRNGGRLAIRLQVTPDWRLDVMSATQHLRTDDTQYVIMGTHAAAAGSSQAMVAEGGQMAPGQRSNGIREVHNNDFAHIAAALEGELGWAGVTSTLAYVHHTYSSQYDAVSALDLFGAQPTSLGAYVESARTNMLVQDLVLRSTAPGPFTWLAGAYAARTTERTPSVLTILSPPTGSARVYQEHRRDRLSEGAIYGEASYRPAENWTVTVGGRLFESRVHTASDIVVDAPGVSRMFDGSRKFNGFLPKVSLQREFAGGDLVYALFSEGYRPGGFNTSGFVALRPGRIVFAADRLRNYELGAKLHGADGRLAFRTAAFYAEWRNIQTDQYRITSGLAYTANVADARILGLEGELSYAWGFGLSLQLNGLVQDSDVRRPNLDFAAKVASTLPGVPKTSGGLVAVYQRAIPGNLTLRLVGEASYIGSSDLSFDATLATRTGDYLRARLAAEIGTDHWRASVFVSNPLDDRSDTFAYGNPFTFGQVQQSTPQRPRTVGLRLGAAF